MMSETRTFSDKIYYKLVDVIRKNSKPLSPLPTGKTSRIEINGTIGAVLFDIYGTLFISGSGDIGTNADSGRAAAFIEAMKRAGIVPAETVQENMQTFEAELGREAETHFYRLIKESHAAARAENVDYPEVDIVRIWDHLFAVLTEKGFFEDGNKVKGVSNGPITRENILICAMEYESIINPVWPMPNAREVIGYLNEKKIPLGIISNAQMFTPALFTAFFDSPPEQLGFDTSLTIYSYNLGRAKPTIQLFQQAKSRIERKWALRPSEVLYVGNDMLNDVYTAFRVGFKTALFAGDCRSLRLRDNDKRCRNLVPDATITDLNQIYTLDIHINR